MGISLNDTTVTLRVGYCEARTLVAVLQIAENWGVSETQPEFDCNQMGHKLSKALSSFHNHGLKLVRRDGTPISIDVQMTGVQFYTFEKLVMELCTAVTRETLDSMDRIILAGAYSLLVEEKNEIMDHASGDIRSVLETMFSRFEHEYTKADSLVFAAADIVAKTHGASMPDVVTLAAFETKNT